MKRVFLSKYLLPLIGLSINATGLLCLLLAKITDAIYAATISGEYMGWPMFFLLCGTIISILCVPPYIADIVLSLIRDRSARSIAWAVVKGLFIAVFIVASILYFDVVAFPELAIRSGCFAALFVVELAALLATPKAK